MLRGPVTCLVVKKGYLDDFLRTVLFEAGLQLMRKHKQAMDFKNRTSEGRVRTEFVVVNLASISGVKFIAEFHAADQEGSVEVHYLIEHRDLSEELLMAVGTSRERGDGGGWSPTGTVFTDAELKAVVDAPPRPMTARPPDAYVN